MIVSSKNVKKLMNRRDRKRAQGMTEYIIIVGLIGLLLVAAVGKFRDALGGAFSAGAGTITNHITDQMK